jgi:hypothetical protein
MDFCIRPIKLQFLQNTRRAGLAPNMGGLSTVFTDNFQSRFSDERDSVRHHSTGSAQTNEIFDSAPIFL